MVANQPMPNSEQPQPQPTPLPIRREFMEILLQVCSLDEWRLVVKQAVAQAQEGDPAARAFLAALLFHDNPPDLLDVAAANLAGRLPIADVAKRAREYAKEALVDSLTA